MAFRLSTFLGSVAKPEIVANETVTWRRRMSPTPGGQNYSLGTRYVPKQSASGPLNIIARPFRPMEPTTAYSERGRQIANASYGGAGILNGQLMSQPLVNMDFGGFTRQFTPIWARPFDVNGIRPAGKF